MDSNITMPFKLKPFTTPNFVIVDMPPTGGREATSIPLKDLDEATLHLLCDQFIRDVFIKAGKTI